MTHQVLVYGTLRKGHGNYLHYLTKSNFLGKSTSLLGSMYSLGGFPAILLEGDTPIVGEVFEVDDETFRNLDGLEGYPTFYNRTEVPTEYGLAWVYHLSPESRHIHTDNLIANGDWSDFCATQRSRY